MTAAALIAIFALVVTLSLLAAPRRATVQFWVIIMGSQEH